MRVFESLYRVCTTRGAAGGFGPVAFPVLGSFERIDDAQERAYAEMREITEYRSRFLKRKIHSARVFIVDDVAETTVEEWSMHENGKWVHRRLA